MEQQRIEVSGEVTGPEDPNQTLHEDSEVHEQEVQAEGQAEQAPEEHAFEVPDKFMQEDGTVDVEALSQSYMELERMRSGVPEEGDEVSENPELSQRQEGELLSTDEMQGYADQVLQDGNLSDASYDDLESRGLPRDLVSAYVEGQKALMEQSRSEMLGAVGGEEAYTALTAWAEQNLSESEIEAYDNVMNSGDRNTIMMSIQGLHARYQQAEGRPNIIAGDVGNISGSNGFRSWSEVTTAMKDTRYRTDPAYRADVTNRLSVSNLQ